MCWFVPIEQLYPPLFTWVEPANSRHIRNVAEFAVGQFKIFPMWQDLRQDLRQLNLLNVVGKL